MPRKKLNKRVYITEEIFKETKRLIALEGKDNKPVYKLYQVAAMFTMSSATVVRINRATSFDEYKDMRAKESAKYRKLAMTGKYQSTVTKTKEKETAPMTTPNQVATSLDGRSSMLKGMVALVTQMGKLIGMIELDIEARKDQTRAVEKNTEALVYLAHNLKNSQKQTILGKFMGKEVIKN